MEVSDGVLRIKSGGGYIAKSPVWVHLPKKLFPDNYDLFLSR